MLVVHTIFRTYREELEHAGCVDVQRTLEAQFPSWFKKHVSLVSLSFVYLIISRLLNIKILQIVRLRYVEGQDISVELFVV